MKSLLSRPSLYVWIGLAATVAFFLLLLVGYGLFQNARVDTQRAGPVSEWVAALIALFNVLVLFYQLRVLGIAAARLDARNVELVHVSALAQPWNRESLSPGWLIAVTVQNESESALLQPVVLGRWRARPLDEQWIIGSPAGRHEVRRSPTLGESLAVALVDIPTERVACAVLLLHVPLYEARRASEVLDGMQLQLLWGIGKRPSPVPIAVGFERQHELVGDRGNA